MENRRAAVALSHLRWRSMFYRHWLSRCFPELHVDQVPVLLGQVQEVGSEHDAWIIAGAGDGPLHPLLPHPCSRGVPRFSRRRLVYDQDEHFSPKKQISPSLFRPVTAEALHRASDTSTTDGDILALVMCRPRCGKYVPFSIACLCLEVCLPFYQIKDKSFFIKCFLFPWLPFVCFPSSTTLHLRSSSQ